MADARGPGCVDAAGRLRHRRRSRCRGDGHAGPLPVAGRAVVTLYAAAGCHLCESARRVIERVRSETPFDLEEIDIAGDPVLEERYRERIPVVLVNGEEAFSYFVHPDGLRRRLLT